MKITTEQLRRIIREEIAKVTGEIKGVQEATSTSTKDTSMFNRGRTISINKGAGSGSQSFGPKNSGKEINLSRVKVGMPIRVRVRFNKGAGSGSSGSYDIEGFVKGFAGDKLRIIPPDETGTKSTSVDIRSIIRVYDLTKIK